MISTDFPLGLKVCQLLDNIELELLANGQPLCTLVGNTPHPAVMVTEGQNALCVTP